MAVAAALVVGGCGGPTGSPAPSTSATASKSQAAATSPAATQGTTSTAPSAGATPPPGTVAPACATDLRGSRVTVLAAAGPWADAMAAAKSGLEAVSGISVEVRTVARDRYAEALAGGGAGGVDVVELPLDAAAAAWAADGDLVPLGPYLADPRLTDASWDLADFPAGILAAGEAPPGAADAAPYAIPTVVETSLLYYDRDLVDRHLGGRVPATMAELLAGARTISAAGAGDRIYGAVVRGVRSATTIDPISSVTFDAWGAEPAPLPYGLWFDGAWARPRLSDPRILAGLTDYAGLLDAGPPNAAAIDRPDARTLFSQGRAGLLVESSAVGPSFEDSATSKVAGRTGYAVLPPSTAGAPSFSGHTAQGLALPARADAKEAAWCFVAWATSPSMTARTGAATAGAPRLSAYVDPAVTSAFDPGFVAAMREAIGTSRPTAVLHGGWDDGALAVVDLVLAIAGGADPEAAAARQDRALRRMMAP